MKTKAYSADVAEQNGEVQARDEHVEALPLEGEEGQHRNLKQHFVMNRSTLRKTAYHVQQRVCDKNTRQPLGLTDQKHTTALHTTARSATAHTTAQSTMSRKLETTLN